MKRAESVEDRILVVDDSEATLELIRRNLESNGYCVSTSTNVEDALRRLDEGGFNLVITDIKMPKVSGMELIRHIRENHRDIEVMTITGYPSVNNAVDAVKTGAQEYLTKPFTDDELLSAVRRVFEKARRKKKLHGGYESKMGPAGLIGSSKAMLRVYSSIKKAAETSATVLITGESGTGKELVARAVHYSSQRSSAPFVAVNCGGIPEGLLESELFGHVKCAFTGAKEARAGFFLTADGGSIFLDEIGEMPPAMQVKLLRVLQEKELTMVGASKVRRVDVRVIAASNKDLSMLARVGLFREDLYFRLNVLSIDLPPLRERDDDLLLLMRYFSDKYSKEYGRSPLEFSDGVIKALQRYDWPGNIRELENLLQRLVVMSEGPVVELPDLPRYIRFSIPREESSLRSLEEVELEHIKNVLSALGGNKTQAARVLGIDRKTLRTKLKALDNQVEQKAK